MKVEELEEELHMKTDQLLHAFSRQNVFEVEIASMRKDQQAALEHSAKLESDVFHYLSLSISFYSSYYDIPAFVEPCRIEVC